MKFITFTLALTISSFAYAENHSSHGAKKEHGHEHQHEKKEPIEVHDAVIKTTPPGITNSAAYFTIINNGKKDITLLNVTSDGAQRVEMHEHVLTNGALKMQKMEPLKIAAGSSVDFKPGGSHIMLIGVTNDINEGDKVDITLSFDNGTQKNITTVAKKQHSSDKKVHKHSHKHH